MLAWPSGDRPSCALGPAPVLQKALGHGFQGLGGSSRLVRATPGLQRAAWPAHATARGARGHLASQSWEAGGGI